MVGLVFHFEDTDMDVWSGRPIDMDAWHYTSKMFGLGNMVMIDQMKGGMPYDQKAYGDFGTTTIEKVKSLDEFLDKYPKQEKVWLETPWSYPSSVTPTTLANFVHPKDNVFYVLGPGGGFTIPENDKRTWVTIPQLTTGAHHSVFIAPILLYDRATKLGIV